MHAWPFREPASAWTHLAGLMLALPGAVILWRRGGGEPGKRISLLIYAHPRLWLAARLEFLGLLALAAWWCVLQLSPSQSSFALLVAVASVATGTVLWVGWWLVRWAIRRRVLFGVRPLMVAIAVMGVVMSLLLRPLQYAYERRQWLHSLQRARGVVAKVGGITSSAGGAATERLHLSLKDPLEHRDFIENNSFIKGQSLTVSEMGDLAGHPNLTHLTLKNCRISDSGLEQLGRSRKLKFLTLTGTPVGEEAAKKLRLALPRCEIKW